MLKSILKVKDKVEYLLNLNKVFKDDDNKLIARIWASEVADVRNKSAYELLKLFGEGKLSSPEAIRRARQKLQELDPALRGDLWDARHTKGKVTRVMIKTLNGNNVTIKKKKRG